MLSRKINMLNVGIDSIQRAEITETYALRRSRRIHNPGKHSLQSPKSLLYEENGNVPIINRAKVRTSIVQVKTYNTYITTTYIQHYNQYIRTSNATIIRHH